MSTRCQIKIWIANENQSSYELKHSLYHHCDGYPYWPESAKENGTGGMLEDIKTVLKSLTTTNGLEENIDKYFNDIDGQYELEDKDCVHEDLDYVYHLYLNFDAEQLKRLKDAKLLYVKIGFDCKDYESKILEPNQKELEFGWSIFFSEQGNISKKI